METKMLDTKGISALDLLKFLKIYPLKNKFLCWYWAGGSHALKRGVSREKAIAQLARNTGTFFLASQDVE